MWWQYQVEGGHQHIQKYKWILDGQYTLTNQEANTAEQESPETQRRMLDNNACCLPVDVDLEEKPENKLSDSNDKVNTSTNAPKKGKNRKKQEKKTVLRSHKS